MQQQQQRPPPPARAVTIPFADLTVTFTSRHGTLATQWVISAGSV
jgi:hypothetical protein